MFLESQSYVHDRQVGSLMQGSLTSWQYYHSPGRSSPPQLDGRKLDKQDFCSHAYERKFVQREREGEREGERKREREREHRRPHSATSENTQNVFFWVVFLGVFLELLKSSKWLQCSTDLSY